MTELVVLPDTVANVPSFGQRALGDDDDRRTALSWRRSMRVATSSMSNGPRG